MAAPPDPLLLTKYRALAQALRNEPTRSEIEGIAREVLLRDLRNLGTQLNLPASLIEQGEEQAFLNTLISEIDRVIEEGGAPAAQMSEELGKERKETEEPSHKPPVPTGRVQKEEEEAKKEHPQESPETSSRPADVVEKEMQKPPEEAREEQRKREETQRPSRRPSFRSVQRGLQRTRGVTRRGASLFRRFAPRTARAFLSPLPRAFSTLLNIPRATIGGILRGVGNIVGGFLRQLAFGAARTLIAGAGSLFASPVTWIVIGVIIIILLLTFFFLTLFSFITPLPDTSPSRIDLTQCTFTRDSLRTPPTQGPVRSSILARLMEDVAQRASMPSPILAAVAFVESSDFVRNADDNHDGILNNYYYIVSQANLGSNRETNAIGLMQISTGRTYLSSGVTDHCSASLLSTMRTAAGKLGKRIHDEAGDGGISYYCLPNADDRIGRFCQTNRREKNRTYYTPDIPLDDSYLDLCRLHDNLMVGAEFLNALMGSGQWTNENDVRRVTSGYYGGCSYPTGNYCDEVWNSYLACTASPTQAPITPGGPRPTPPPPPTDLVTAISAQFGITMTGFSRQHMEWAWQKFWDVSSTDFINLVRGTSIRVVAPSATQQTGCRTVDLGALTPEELFKVVLIHELGHIMRNCNSQAIIRWDEHMAVWQLEGGVTNYARIACTYSNPGAFQYQSEDYAEMITYYLNPNASEQTARCAGTAPNPYSGGGYPLHFNLAREILGVY